MGLKGGVVLFHDDLGRSRIQGNHRAVQLTKNLRQNHRRGAVVVVDHDLERRSPHRLEVELRDQVLQIALRLLVAPRDPAHLVMRDAADILAKEQSLELALASLVDVEAMVVEDADVGRAGIDRRRLHVHSRHVVVARPITADRGRQHREVDDVGARRDHA
ncbi:MAG: hypothetical protein E6H85_13195 [Chloroflexi bacterium]|nr:MAG: hypothetical protein E6H85_13195 [Chloroflexota bacterium]